MNGFRLMLVLLLSLTVGCSAFVDITKTAKGFYAPSNASDVEILKTVPSRKYVELGTLTVTDFAPTDIAKMHNAIRTKAAPLGASAVILTEEGLAQAGVFNSIRRWAFGVAIRYE